MPRRYGAGSRRQTSQQPAALSKRWTRDAIAAATPDDRREPPSRALPSELDRDSPVDIVALQAVVGREVVDPFQGEDHGLLAHRHDPQQRRPDAGGAALEVAEHGARAAVPRHLLVDVA